MTGAGAATENDFMAIDSNGNIKDSGKKESDFQAAITDNAVIGFGVGTCSTAASTVAKTVSITGYQLVKNGYVTVTFENAVPANATLNINSLGAKPIYFKSAAIVDNIINAGDTVTFCYDGTNYVVASPVGVSKITIRTYSDAAKTTPITGILDISFSGGTTAHVKTPNGVGVIYHSDGNATVTSLYADLDISTFTVNGDTVVDIVVTNSQFVDLGLPSGTLWARGNIVKDSQGNYSLGSPEEEGCMFSWGNIVGYNSGEYDFTSANYQLTPGYTLFNNMQASTSIASNDAEHDAAVALLGGDWHMPTVDDLREMFNSEYTTHDTVEVNGVKGLMVTSISNGNSIFITAGYPTSVSMITALTWGSTKVNIISCWHILSGTQGGTPYYYVPYGGGHAYDGMNIRPVL